jgi:hypothetical protein
LDNVSAPSQASTAVGRQGLIVSDPASGLRRLF